MEAPGSSSTLNTTDTSAATTLAPAPNAQEREAKTAWQETPDNIKGPGGVKYDEGLGGQEEFSGAHSAQGYSGGPTSAKLSSGGSAEEKAGGTTSDTYASSGSAEDGSRGGITAKSSLGDSAEEKFGDTTGAKSSSGGSTEDKFGDTTSAKSSSGGSADPAPSYVASVHSDPAKTGKPHGKNITEGGFDSDPSKNASFNSEIGDENDPGRVAENQFQRQTMESGLDAAPSAPRQKEVTNDGQYDILESEQNL